MLNPKLLIAVVLALAGTARAEPLSIVTQSVPPATYNQDYRFSFQAAGGVPPYQWCGPGASCPWLNGGLPQGIFISADGQISGTPQAPGSYAFQVEVQDAAGSRLDQFFTLNIPATANLIITVDSLPVAVLGQSYEVYLSAEGGTPPYASDMTTAGWLLVDTKRLPLSPGDSGADQGRAPPAGLSLDLDGRLGGTPTQAGNFTLAIQLTDSSSPPQVVSKVFPLTILPSNALGILNPTVPTATVGQSYSVQLETSDLAWETVAFVAVDDMGRNSPAALASLPPGISLSPTGLLSGVPTTAGSYSFQVQISDGQGRVFIQGIAVVVMDPAPAAALKPIARGCSTSGGGASGAGLLIVLGQVAVSRRRRLMH
jgi:uncharacterized protein (TIGR03382 family)